MTPLAIALGLVGLAAVLAAWSLGARWLAVTHARVRSADVEAVRAEVGAAISSVCKASEIHAAHIAKLREDVDDHAAQLREARLAKMGGRR